MDRPVKRLRIGQAPYDDDEDDELGLEPEEFEQLELSKDPGYQLEQGRAKAAYKLKSTFEQIFEKYEKDFTDVGDEIDLRTGEIVVDNGHIQSMKNARDDVASQAGRLEDAQSEVDSIEEEERILHGGKIGPNGSSIALMPRAFDNNGGQLPRLSSLMDGSSRLTDMMPFSRMPFTPFTPPRSFASFAIPSDPIESPWRAPELPSSAFSTAFRPQSLLGQGIRGSARAVVRKSLPRPQIIDERQVEDADEDDILLGVSGNGLRRKGLPSPRDNNEQAHDAGENSNIQNEEVTPPNAKESRPETLESGTFGNSPRVKKTVQSMRPPEPSPKPARNKQRAKATRPKSQKNKTIVIVQSTGHSTGVNDAVTSKKRSRSQQASSSPKQVLVVKSRKRKADSLVQGSAAVLDRKSTRERQQIEFYRNADWAKRGDPKERALYVELSTRGIDTTAYSRVDIRATPTRSPAKPIIQGFVEELEIGDDLPASLEAAPAEAIAIVDGEVAVPLQEIKEGRKPAAQKEVFSRNVVDPSYAFSDDEDDWPRRKDISVHSSTDTGSAAAPQVAPAREPNGTAPKRQKPSFRKPRASLETSRNGSRRKSPAIVDMVRLGSVELGEELDQSTKAVDTRNTTPVPGEALSEANATKQRRDSSTTGAQQKSSSLGPSPDAEAESPPEAAQIGGVPLTPKHKKTQVEKPTPQPESARTGIISLVSDDEEDELSFNTEDLTSSGARRRSLVLHKSSPMLSASTPRKASRNRSFLVSSHSKAHTPLRVSLGSTGKLSKSKSLGGRYSLPRSVIRVKSSRGSSPSTSLVRTPGGTLRRCGEDGFKCDRDFCFTCM